MLRLVHLTSLTLELRHERTQVVARATHQVVVHLLDVCLVGLRDARFQIEKINLFDSGTHTQRLRERLITLRDELIVQLLECRVGKDTGARACRIRNAVTIEC
jgi:hypothetical protein